MKLKCQQTMFLSLLNMKTKRNSLFSVFFITEYNNNNNYTYFHHQSVVEKKVAKKNFKQKKFSSKSPFQNYRITIPEKVVLCMPNVKHRKSFVIKHSTVTIAPREQ
ncbi:hypothetical protein BLA29_009693 [Euroglyphus maynei]|uniref:Uncharacterized protein n=1 Tax=Euroglyphus maynei TaxID=6958 RepID=A0A1Y3ALU9_EURMA|nr:hypothetical protein BLA29_009693 [Euroglyphus maynei]